ncbi:GD21347 [Drosophila simulans]|uniref:GD21347 n=1 Tax=Drosophila simulans TaxID=7240 RepID=B4QY31_DROSI|nr:GD21347 [Drosophila simulans]
MLKVSVGKYKFINMSPSWMGTAARLLGLYCLLCVVAMAQGVSNSVSLAAPTASAAKDVAHMHRPKRLDRRSGAGSSPLTAIKQPKQLARSAHGLNKKLLSQMGFMKVKAPNSHNRKRLAVESRRHSSRDDSHMFIIKLPPNMHYYAESRSNGRPGRIYHWNLPVLKEALAKKPHFAHVSAADRNRLLDIQGVPTWRQPWENETAEKGFSAGGGKAKYRKSLKPKSPTYYAPAQAVSKQSFHKYFAGNGKPKGFYVIKEHQKKPQFYQNIIS